MSCHHAIGANKFNGHAEIENGCKHVWVRECVRVSWLLRAMVVSPGATSQCCCNSLPSPNGPKCSCFFTRKLDGLQPCSVNASISQALSAKGGGRFVCAVGLMVRQAKPTVRCCPLAWGKLLSSVPAAHQAVVEPVVLEQCRDFVCVLQQSALRCVHLHTQPPSSFDCTQSPCCQ